MQNPILQIQFCSVSKFNISFDVKALQRLWSAHISCEIVCIAVFGNFDSKA